MSSLKPVCSILIVITLSIVTHVALAQGSAAPGSIHWISSTNALPWHEVPVVMGSDPVGTDTIRINDQQLYQLIDGFGSCFNELGWEALERLDPPARAQVLQALFAKDGANFSLGRVPMGANDFALSWYSYDETPGDYGMKDFSIARDRRAILPFIHAAMEYQPNLAVWAVPWSPPSWMKTNGAYRGGEMKSDPQTLASYALYFSKYISAFRAEGVRLYAVMPQNEPKYNNNIYPQAVWTGSQMDVFLRDYLGPRLRKDRQDIQVWQGTIVNDKLDVFITPVLDDPATNPLVTGVAYQYAGQKTMSETHERYPDKKMMQSETECYNGENSWDQALTTFGKIIDDTRNFAGSYFYWNTVLNDDSKSSWGWKQNSLVTVDRKSGEARYNPEFYSMKHFSSNVLPGAHRVGVIGGPFKEIVAFKNPSGSMVVEFENDSDAVAMAEFQHGGVISRLQVPAKSMNTLILTP